MNLILETNRLILREIRQTDAPALFEMDSAPAVHHYLGNNPVQTIDECYEYIEQVRNQYIQNGISRFAIVLKETMDVIGWAGIKFITKPENNHTNFYDIGYRLQQKHWGKGYGYEAAKPWVDYGFNKLNIQTLYASAHVENKASQRILEKIGLQLKSEYFWNEIPCFWFEAKNPTV